MNYDIVSRLRQHIPNKKSTEIAVFFNYEGRGFRLDWDLPDSAELTEEQIDLEIDKRISAGLAGAQGQDGGVTQANVEEWKGRGAEEW